MSSPDANLIRQALSEASRAQLDELEVFGSIASTNTYLMSQTPPENGRFRVAVADHQTSGRGRHYRRWISPPGAGLYMSLAYSFDEIPEQLPSLTLAIGVGVMTALEDLGVSGASLKWPNDIVAMDGKLGGILTELQSGTAKGATVVIGIGLNLNLPEDAAASIESDWAARTVDLSRICEQLPTNSVIAAVVLEQLHSVIRKFAAYGFAGFAERWSNYDWLLQREVIVDQSDKQVLGVAAGVDSDGALIVETDSGTARVISGSVMVAGLTA